MQEGQSAIFSGSGTPVPAFSSTPAPQTFSRPASPYLPTPAKPSKKKLILIVLILFLAALATATIIYLMFTSKTSKEVPNLRAIFDQTSPVPIRTNSDKFGYVSPTSGSTIINANFTYAERFYGDFAKVATSDRNGDRYQVIDRSGNTVAEPGIDSADASSVSYIIDQDIWQVGSAIYDNKMQRITAESDTAEHLGHGFIRAKANGEEYYSRILDKTGKEVYKCAETPCTVSVGSDFNANGEFYAAIQNTNGTSVLVRLSDGKEVLNLESNKYFIVNGNNLFTIKIIRGAVEKQIFVQGGAIKKEFASNDTLSALGGRNVIRIMSRDDKGTITQTSYYDVDNDKILNEPDASWKGDRSYPSSKLAVFYCESGYYGLTNGSEDILPCEYDNIISLPVNVFEYYSTVKGQDLFVIVSSDIRLFNAKNKSTVKTLDSEDVQFFENSPFYLVDNKLYSLESSSNDNLEVSNASSLECFGNYFIFNGTTYGSNLKNLRETSS